MQTHSRILVVSRDQTLLQTRRLILGTYFDVEAAGRISEAGSVLSKHDFKLVVLCDTLTPDECHRIEELVREHEPTPTLLSILGPGNGYRTTCSGRRLECRGGPLRLIRECAEILGCQLQTKGRIAV